MTLPCRISAPNALLSLLLGLCLCFSSAFFEARAGEISQIISPVCAKANFAQFLEAFVLASKEEQMSCIRFSDFVYKGEKISTPDQLIKSEVAAAKLMFSRQDVNETDKADPKFFYTMPMDDPDNLPAFDHICYIIRQEGEKSSASLTVGGTFALETVSFERDGGNWRVTGVVQEEMQ